MHTTEATYAIKQEGRSTETLFYYGLQDYTHPLTRGGGNHAGNGIYITFDYYFFIGTITSSFFTIT